jgi:CheY-like chemotaxis protein
MNLTKLKNFLESLKLNEEEKNISLLVLKEIINRLTFLENVGLNYLTLNRSAETLSGGEAQRIRLATQIGSKLSGVLYVLDEPSIGLHQRDNQRLINSLKEMRDLGNTLIVVEHDEDTMGGTLGVESKLGEGSTFWIQLPATESQLRILANSEFESSENKLQKSKAGTLLYIEDNSSNIELVEQILNFQRPQVQLISNMNGRQAVVLAIEYKPDLILLDLNLPDIHGSEVLKLLKSNPITKEIPVVVLSADAMQKQIENMITSGASSYLTKPLGLTDFLRVIDEFI